MNYKRVKDNWITGLWNISLLKEAYAKGIITKEEYREIKAFPQMGDRNFSLKELQEKDREYQESMENGVEDGD